MFIVLVCLVCLFKAMKRERRIFVIKSNFRTSRTDNYVIYWTEVIIKRRKEGFLYKLHAVVCRGQWTWQQALQDFSMFFYDGSCQHLLFDEMYCIFRSVCDEHATIQTTYTLLLSISFTTFTFSFIAWV